MDGCEILSTRSRSNPEHILHHKQPGLKMGDVLEVLLVECAPGIVNHPLTMIRPIALLDLAEALAGGAARDYVDSVGPDQLGQLGGGKLREVFAQHMRRVGKVRPVDFHRLRLKINRRDDPQPGPMQPQRKATTARKQVNARQRFIHDRGRMRGYGAKSSSQTVSHDTG